MSLETSVRWFGSSRHLRRFSGSTLLLVLLIRSMIRSRRFILVPSSSVQSRMKCLVVSSSARHSGHSVHSFSLLNVVASGYLPTSSCTATVAAWISCGVFVLLQLQCIMWQEVLLMDSLDSVDILVASLLSCWLWCW